MMRYGLVVFTKTAGTAKESLIDRLARVGR